MIGGSCGLIKRFLALGIAIALVGVVLGGCIRQKQEEAQLVNAVPMGDKGTYSLFLYLCGSDLETKQGAAGKNLDEILKADLPENVQVVVQTGGAEKWRSHDIPSDCLNRYLVEDGRLTLLETLPQASMGDGGTLRDFLQYGVEHYPAEKMCVILWDHGSGSIDGVANDQNFDFDSLTLAEIELALEDVSQTMTDKFEFFGLDACLMANYETAHMLSPYARFMVASEEIEPSGGWDYDVLLAAMADQSSSGREIGKAICDGYYEKCREKGQEDTATLSVIDLESMDELQTAFDEMAGEMYQDSIEPMGIQAIARSAYNAQKFGGTSGGEGYSNLIDLGHFADNAGNLSTAQSVLEALDKAVVYQVTGAQKDRSQGLSFYYPSYPDEDQRKRYCEEVCPSEDYRRYLEQAYTDIPEDPIQFTDRGSIREDGSFQIQLASSSQNYILSVSYGLMEYEVEQKDGSTMLTATLLGEDNDMVGERNLTIHSNFRGVWVTLNGCKLYATMVEDNEEYTIFTAPIVLNGKPTNLRFAFLWDQTTEEGGTYKILGAWNGIDPVTGMSDKGITELRPTDDIQTLTYRQTVEVTEDGDVFYSEEERCLQQVPGGEYTITEEPLEKQDYAYQMVVTDIFGGRHTSYLAKMHMIKTPQELEQNPVEEGQYAAEAESVMETTDTLLE